jgi:hypothetical protein
VQRRSLVQLLDDNPSLRAHLNDFVAAAYASAVDLAWAETGLDIEIFPPQCSYTSSQIVDETFFPE